MTDEIKLRIEQINRGEVPQGYKKTEVGIVPQEWEMRNISEVISDGIKNGIFNDPQKIGGDTKLINVVNLYDEPYIDVDNLEYLNISEKEYELYKVEKYDLFFTRSSLKLEGIAHCNMLVNDSAKMVYDGHIMKIKPLKDYNPFYLCSMFRSPICRKQFMLKAKTTTMTTIGQKDIANVMIPIASYEEQNRIAEILSKWDEVVSLNTKLIDYLKQQKRAYMQKLLSENKNWTKVKIGSLIEEVSKRNTIECTNIKSVSNKYGFINQDEQFSKQVASVDTSNYKIVSYGDIAYNPSRINVGSIAVYKEQDKGIVSPMYVVFKCKDIEPEMLLLILNLARVQYDIKAHLAGSVRNSLSFSDLSEIEINLPSKKEQQSILEFFKNIDTIIALQNNKLNFIKKQQNVMKELLLSGIIRV